MSFPPGTEMFQFPGFASYHYVFMVRYLLLGGLPHSDIHGSTPARGSPWLFAACHVLHRLLVPRHPPNALIALDTHELLSQPNTMHRSKTCQSHDRSALSGACTYLLSIYITSLIAFAAVSEANITTPFRAQLRWHIRSDLADRGTSRDVPEPDSH